MTVQHDLDRTLDAWFHGDATTAPPTAPLARIIESTRNVRPRAALVARIGSSWTDADGTRVTGAGLRPALVLALVALLALALAGGALLVGGRLFSNPSTPAPPGLWRNGVLVVSKDGDIVVADRPGGDLRPLMTGPEDDADPIFSPDGTKLVFLRGGALMLADAGGGNVVQVAADTRGASAWRFSPDGRLLVGTAVLDGEPDGPACEFGNAPRRVLIRPADPAAALTVLDVPLWDDAMEALESGGPAFRPTNPDQVLLVTQLEPCGPRGIHVYDLATNTIRTVLEPAGYVHDVAWTPDGQSITYDLTDETSVQARVVAADGSGDRPLLEAPGTNRYHRVGRWSNDGTRTVIARQPENVRHVVISTGGGGAAVELACGDSKAIRCPAFWIWSPDDSTLIGTLQREDSGDNSTSGVTTLLADPETGEVSELDWDIDLNDPQQWQRVAPASTTAVPSAVPPPASTTAPAPTAPSPQASPVANGTAQGSPPLFSPDGTKVHFLRDGNPMVADADGTNAVRVTLERDVGRISPDGRSEVRLFVGEPNGDEGQGWRIDVTPLEPPASPIVLDLELHDGAQEMYQSGGPEFRPTDPQEILIVGTLTADGPRGIHVYDLATGGIRTIAVPAGYVYNVNWTPDGEAISYDLASDTFSGTRVVAADGSKDRLLHSGGHHALSRWSNDGDRVVIARPWDGDTDGWQPAVVSTAGDGEAVVLACGGTTVVHCPMSWSWSSDDALLIGKLGREDPSDLEASWTTWLLADPRTGAVTQSDWEVDLSDPGQWRPVTP